MSSNEAEGGGSLNVERVGDGTLGKTDTKQSQVTFGDSFEDREDLEVGSPRKAQKFIAASRYLCMKWGLPSAIEAMLVDKSKFSTRQEQDMLQSLMFNFNNRIDKLEWELVLKQTEEWLILAGDAERKRRGESASDSKVPGRSAVSHNSPTVLQPDPARRQMTMNSMLKTIGATLKLKSLPDPKTPSQIKSFGTDLSSYRVRISDYIASGGFDILVGVNYLRTLLGPAKLFELKEALADQKIKSALSSDQSKGFSSLISRLRGARPFQQELLQLKNESFQTLSAINSAYIALLQEHPTEEAARAKDPSLMLNDYQQLVLRLQYYRSHIQMQETMHDTFTSVDEYKRFVQRIENVVSDQKLSSANAIGTVGGLESLHRNGAPPLSEYARHMSGICYRMRDWGRCGISGCRWKHSYDRKYDCKRWMSEMGCNWVRCPYLHDDSKRFSGAQSLQPPRVARAQPGGRGGRGRWRGGGRHGGNQRGRLMSQQDISALVTRITQETINSISSSVPADTKSDSKHDSPPVPVSQNGSLSLGLDMSVKVGNVSLPSFFPATKGDTRPYTQVVAPSGSVDSITALIDTGAQHSVCSVSVAEQLLRSCDAAEYAVSYNIKGVIEGQIVAATKALVVNMPVFYGDSARGFIRASLLVVPHFKGLIIGSPCMIHNNISIRPHNGEMLAVMHNKRISMTTTSSVALLSCACAPIFSSFVISRADVSFTAPRPTATFPMDEADLPSILLDSEDDPSDEVLRMFSKKEGTRAIENLELPDPPTFKMPKLQKHLDTWMAKVESGDTYLSTSEALHIIRAFSRFQNCFVDYLTEVGAWKVKPFEMLSMMKDPKAWIKSKPFKCEGKKREMLRSLLQDQVNANLAYVPNQNQAQCTSPVFIVFQNDKPRVVGAYGKVNDITHEDNYPVATVDTTVTSIAQFKLHILVDQKSAFNQVRQTDDAASRTVYVSQDGLHASKGMRFGPKNAPACFTRRNDEFCASVDPDRRNVIPHVDDLFVMAMTFPQLFSWFVRLLQRAEETNLKFKIQKIQIALRQFKALGYLFKDGGHTPDPSRIKPIQDIAPPRTVKHAQGVLGTFGYWSKFIPKYQEINKPIRDVVTEAKKSGSTKVKWTDSADRSLKLLKRLLLQGSVLHFPDYSKITKDCPFDLFTDANAIAMGYIAIQTLFGVPKIMACGSKALSAVMQRYHINRKEMMASIWALTKERTLFAYQWVRLNFDSANMKFYSLKAQRKLSPVWSRLAAALDAYPRLIKRFVRGVINVIADLFTRYTTTVIDAKADDEPVSELFPTLSRLARSGRVEEVDLGMINLIRHGAGFVDTLPLFNQQVCKLSIATANDEVDVAVVGITQHTSTSPLHIAVAVGTPEFDLINLQANDGPTQAILAILRDSTHREHYAKSAHFVERDGTLFQWSPNSDLKTNTRWLRLFVPQPARKKIFAHYHSLPLGCHYGTNETCVRVGRSFAWPGMTKNIQQWVKECNICTKIRGKVQRVAYVSPPLKSFGELWSVDYVGPFTPSVGGYEYALCMTEMSTGYPEVFKSKGPDSKALARVLMHEIIPRHGFMSELLSDLGSAFISDATKYLCRMMGTTQRFASVGNSRGNSRQERSHLPITAGIVANILQRNCTKGNWPKFIPATLFALRNHVPAGRRYSPNELLMGRQCPFPADLVNSEPETKMSRDMRLICKDVDAFFKNLRIIRQHAAEADVEFRTEKNKYKNRTAEKPVIFAIGDWVLLNTQVDIDQHRVQSKLDVNWVGPYLVLELIPPYSYKLQHHDTQRVTKPIHGRLLRKYYMPDVPIVRAPIENEHSNNDIDASPPASPVINQHRRSTRERRQPRTMAPMINSEPQWESFDHLLVRRTSVIAPGELVLDKRGRSVKVMTVAASSQHIWVKNSEDDIFRINKKDVYCRVSKTDVTFRSQ